MTEYDGNQMALTQLSGGGWPGTAVGDAPMVEQGICSTEGNATVQQEEQPLILNLSGLFAAGTEQENLSNYQIVAAGFFAQTREPALTISGNKVGVNAAAARLFPQEDYMEILINPEEKKVAFKPCDEYNIAGYRWAKTKDGKRYATQRTGLPFVLCVCQIMGWNPTHRYHILGRKLRSETNEEILLFDLKAGQEFEKSDADAHGKKQRSSILTGWDGIFGPTFGKNHSSLHVDTFDGYTYFSIKEGVVQDNARHLEAGPGSENEEKTE